MEWIKFDDMTPEEGQRCVVFTEEQEYKTASYNEDDGQFEDLEYGDTILNVLAWQPLYECVIF